MKVMTNLYHRVPSSKNREDYERGGGGPRLSVDVGFRSQIHFWKNGFFLFMCMRAFVPKNLFVPYDLGLVRGSSDLPSHSSVCSSSEAIGTLHVPIGVTLLCISPRRFFFFFCRAAFLGLVELVDVGC